MAQPPDHQTEDIYPSKEEILSMTDYMNNPERSQPSTDRGLAKLPHANQTKVIVLTYKMKKNPELQEQHKST